MGRIVICILAYSFVTYWWSYIIPIQVKLYKKTKTAHTAVIYGKSFKGNKIIIILSASAEDVRRVTLKLVKFQTNQ